MAGNAEQHETLEPRSVTKVPGHPAELWQCIVPEELWSSQGAFFGSPGGTCMWAALAAWGDGDMSVLLVEKGFPVGADLRVALLD